MRRSDAIRSLTHSGGRPVSAQDLAALYQRYAILYVDDEVPNLMVFDATFGEEFHVVCVGSGAEALAVIEREPISVVISDNRMPDMTGIELCSEVVRRHPHVLRVLCTAYSDQQTAIDAINVGGVHNYLVKPWDADKVRDLIRELIAMAHFEGAARALRQGLLSEERRAAVTVMRKRVHYELTDVITVVRNATDGIDEALPEVRASLRAELADDVVACLEDLRAANDKLTAIHKETRAASDAEAAVASEENLCEVVEAVTHLVWAELTGVATLEHTCGPDLWMFADRVSVLRILFNLVTHCVRSIEGSATRPGVVRMLGHRQGNRVCVDISHNAPANLEAVRRALASSALTGIATNPDIDLGLPVSRELAEANGGTLEMIEGEAPWTPVLRLSLPDAESN